MAYKRTEWVDHIVSPTGEVLQEGTPISATNLNKIEEGIEKLSTDLGNIKVPPASLTEPGIVQLSNATNSTNETMAVTPKAVHDVSQALNTHLKDETKHITKAERDAWNAKETPDGAQSKANKAEENAKNASLPRTGGTVTGNLAVTNTLTVASRNIIQEIDNLKQSGVELKQGVAGVLNAKGVPTSAQEPNAQIIGKVNSLIKEKEDSITVLEVNVNGESTITLATLSPGIKRMDLSNITNTNFLSYPVEKGYLRAAAELRLVDGFGQSIVVDSYEGDYHYEGYLGKVYVSYLHTINYNFVNNTFIKSWHMTANGSGFSGGSEQKSSHVALNPSNGIRIELWTRKGSSSRFTYQFQCRLLQYL